MINGDISDAPETKTDQTQELISVIYTKAGAGFYPTARFLQCAPDLGIVSDTANAKRYYRIAYQLLNEQDGLQANQESVMGLSQCLTLLDDRDRGDHSRVPKSKLVEYAATAGRRVWIDSIAADSYTFADQYYNFQNRYDPYPELGVFPADYEIMAADKYGRWGFPDLATAVTTMQTVADIYQNEGFVDSTAYEIAMSSPRMVEHVNGTVTEYGQVEAKAALYRFLFLQAIVPEQHQDQLLPRLGLPQRMADCSSGLPVWQIGRYFTEWDRTFLRDAMVNRQFAHS